VTVLEHAQKQKCRILVCVAGLLQPEDFAELYHQYPTVAHVFRDTIAQLSGNQANNLNNLEKYIRHSQPLVDAVHHALDLAKTRHPSQFARLSCKVFGAGTCPLDTARFALIRDNLFTEGALHTVYSWRPPLWHIPEEDEVSALEALLCRPGDSDTQLHATDEGEYYYCEIGEHVSARMTRWFFSATAVAIKFSKSYTLEVGPQ